MFRGSRYALVAGGAGFVGSHLVDSLLEDGYHVDVVDDLSTGSPSNLPITKDGPLRLLYQSTVATTMDPSHPDGRYDTIYNLASPASPKAYQADGHGCIMTNVVGTSNLLALAEAHDCPMVQASTSEIYGDPLEHPQRESYWGNVNPYGPRAVYDESKRCAETLCFEARHRRMVDARVARIFNTYGPRLGMNDGRVVSTFIRQAILNEPLTAYGDGEQTRSFCYVEDLVRGLRLLAKAEAWSHGPVNLGNDGEFTILELSQALAEWFPRLLVTFEPLPKDDPIRRKPDLSLARRELSYEPKVPLRVGLERTIAWMKSVLRPEEAR